jgi:hypothetical protein
LDDTKKLLLEIDASVELLRRNLSKAEGHLNDFTRRADRQIGTFEKRFAESGRGIAGVGRTLDTMRGKMDSFGASLKGAVAGYFAAVGIDTLTRLVKSGLEYASSLGEQAQQLGVTTRALQEYRYAATQTGVSQEEMDNALSMGTKRLGEAAAGAKPTAEAYKKLGVEIRDAGGNVRNFGDLIPEIAEGISKLPSEAEQAAAATKIFGKSAQSLMPFLKEGKSGIDELRNAAQRLGIVLSEEQIRKADEAADKLGQLKTVMEANIAVVVADNADSILELATALAELVASIGDAIKWYRQLREEFAIKFQYGIASNSLVTPQLRAQFLASANNRSNALESQKIRDRFSDLDVSGVVSAKGKSRNLLKLNGKSNAVGDTDLFNFFGGNRFRQPLSVGSGKGLPNLADPQVQASLRATAQMADLLNKPTKEAVAKLNEWNVQIARMNADLALAQADLTGSLQQRADAEKQAIDADLQSDRLRIAADKDLTAAQRQKQIAVQEEIASARKALVDRKLEEELAEQSRDAEEEALRLKLDALDDEQRTLDVVARSTRDRAARLEIERRILAIQQEEERARLEAAIAAGEIADAARARANLETRQAAERGDLEKQGAGPGAQYLDGLRKSASELNDDLDRIAADGLQSLNDGLADAIVNGQSLGKMFNRIADQIIADLLRIAIQQAIIRPLAEGLFGGGSVGGSGGGLFGGLLSAGSAAASSGKSGGGLFGSLFGAIGSIFKPKGARAMGGPVSAGQAYLVGERRPELFVPNVDGKILPDANVGGGGSSPSQLINFTINAPGATAETVAMIRREIASAAPQIAAAAKSATMRDLGRQRL